MRSFSVGELQNQINQSARAKKEIIQKAFNNLKLETKQSLSIGYKIVWYGFCFSIVIFMAVRAFMIAL